MPAATFEELSLLAFCTMHFGQQPAVDWVQALLQETMFKMDQVRGCMEDVWGGVGKIGEAWESVSQGVTAWDCVRDVWAHLP